MQGRDIRRKRCRTNIRKKIKKSKRASGKYMQDLETKGEEAVAKGNIKELYNVTRQIRGKGRSSGGPIKDSSGKLISKHDDQMERWKEYFSTLLNLCRDQIYQQPATAYQ